jgi:hypothetical protein
MAETLSIHWTTDRCKKKIWLENMKVSEHLKNTGADKRIIIKWIWRNRF